MSALLTRFSSVVTVALLLFGLPPAAPDVVVPPEEPEAVEWEIPWFPEARSTRPVPEPEGTPWSVALEEIPSDAVPWSPTDDTDLLWLSREEVLELFATGSVTEGGEAVAGEMPAAQPASASGRIPGVAANAASGSTMAAPMVIPRGEVGSAGSLTLVFSSAMVALGDVDADDLPVALDPAPEGTWSWLDPHTLRFEPAAGRLPGGTRYTVTVPEGTLDLAGARLAEDHVEVLELRGPRALGGAPNRGITEWQPVFLLKMDQDTDPAIMAASAVLGFDGGTMGLEPAELDDVPEVHREAAERLPGGVPVAIRAAGDLPAETDVTLRLGADLTSVEGPLPSGRPQTLSFRTKGAFRVETDGCLDADTPCRVDAPVQVAFSTPIDPDQPLADLVQLDPLPHGLRVEARGRNLHLWGDFQPHTAYDLVLNASLQDTFGQSLGAQVSEILYLGGAGRFLTVGHPPLVTVPAAGFQGVGEGSAARLELLTRGVTHVELRQYDVDPAEWEALVEEGGLGADPQRPLPPESRLRSVDTLHIEDGERMAAYREVALDAAFLEDGGHLLAVGRELRDSAEGEGVDPGLEEFGDESVDEAPLSGAVWVQSTSLGVEVVRGADDARVLVTTPSGDPVPGAGVRLGAEDTPEVTDDRGIAVVSLPVEGLRALRVEHDGRVTLVQLPGASWASEGVHPRPVWHAETDRGVYRAGEPLRLQGWIREFDEARQGLGLPTRAGAVGYQVTISSHGDGGRVLERGRVLAEGEVELTPAGGFQVAADLPRDVGAGMVEVRIRALTSVGSPDPDLEGWEIVRRVQVQEFRRPEYETSVEASHTSAMDGESFEVVAEALYFDGPPPLRRRGDVAYLREPQPLRARRVGRMELRIPGSKRSRVPEHHLGVEGDGGRDGRQGAPRHPHLP